MTQFVSFLTMNIIKCTYTVTASAMLVLSTVLMAPVFYYTNVIKFTNLIIPYHVSLAALVPAQFAVSSMFHY